MEKLKPIVFVGVGAAASLGLWWLLSRRKTATPLAGPPDPEIFQRPVAKVAKVFFYPVKSCHRIELDSCECLFRGLAYDRTFVFVDKDGQFLHQRRVQSLAQVQPRLVVPSEGDGSTKSGITLYLTAPGMPELTVTEPPASAPTEQIRIWRMYGEGLYVGDEAAAWISTFLKMEGCRMYYMSPSNKPRVLLEDTFWKTDSFPGEETSFADTSPLLVVSEASLETLNSKLDTPIPMERFRPNIVLSGCGAHEEDSWGLIKIGENLIIRNLKPCGRCKLTTVDQEEGQFTGTEPLVTLRTYRLYETVYNEVDERHGNAPLFGANCTVISPGHVHVGDTVYAQSVV